MRSSRTSATLAALALAASAGAATAADTPVSDTQAQAAAAAQADSRRAVRDQVTGKLRAPTPEEAEAMRAARAAGGVAEPGARSGPLRVVQHGGGMRSAVLGTEYLVTLKAQRRADGSLAITHNQPGLDHPVSRDLRPTE
ncbi:MAG: hypothetical protein Q8R33_00695 [Burkholderiales bacterium]|nr:hypothetical protein [Burkholderiales bacterium]